MPHLRAQHVGPSRTVTQYHLKYGSYSLDHTLASFDTYRLIKSCVFTFASEFWQNNAYVLRFWCIKCTNPEGWTHWTTRGGGYSTLSWVRMCGLKFRPPLYNKTREDANLLPISKPFVSGRALFKTNQCFLQCKLGCISTFWQPIDKPNDKFIGNYALCKNATYI